MVKKYNKILQYQLTYTNIHTNITDNNDNINIFKTVN